MAVNLVLEVGIFEDMVDIISTEGTKPIIVWFRRDLRLKDNPAFKEAVDTCRPVIPLFIYDEFVEAMGAAPKWRLSLSIASFTKDLSNIGVKLVLRRGSALLILKEIIAETDAQGVFWSRLYDDRSVRRDGIVKDKLKGLGIEAKSFHGHLLHEPWSVNKKEGGFYKVYSPFWRVVSKMTVPSLIDAPKKCLSSPIKLKSENLSDWQLDKDLSRSKKILGRFVNVGENAANERLDYFLKNTVSSYEQDRDMIFLNGTSRLSENLTYGEISPWRIWHRATQSISGSNSGIEKFLKELVWRDFAWSLAYNTPHILHSNWKVEWNHFPWRGPNKDSELWCRGMTGEPLVDAGMRELYTTGTMHNRVRMIVASYLTKHLLTDWRVGQEWFASRLIDWDPASNAMGWQWVAGSGPDATPFFRIFNPETQAKKFDKDSKYINRFLGVGSDQPPSLQAKLFFDMVPKSWNFDYKLRYPNRIMGLKEGRDRALTAYNSFRKSV